MLDNTTAPYGAFVLRVALGVMFLAHAALKIFVFTPAGTVGFFQSLGLPSVLAYGTIAAELTGGLLLIAGMYTRQVSLALVPLLLGAIVLVHGANGWQFGNEGGGWEYPAFLIFASIAQALLGDGAFSVKSANRAPKRPAIA